MTTDLALTLISFPPARFSKPETARNFHCPTRAMTSRTSSYTKRTSSRSSRQQEAQKFEPLSNEHSF